MNRKVTEWEKIYIKHIIFKGIIFKCKRTLQITNKNKKTQFLKMGKRFQQANHKRIKPKDQ